MIGKNFFTEIRRILEMLNRDSISVKDLQHISNFDKIIDFCMKNKLIELHTDL